VYEVAGQIYWWITCLKVESETLSMEPLLVNDSASAKQEQQQKPKTRLENLAGVLDTIYWGLQQEE
jgi:hypothetical protein